MYILFNTNNLKNVLVFNTQTAIIARVHVERFSFL